MSGGTKVEAPKPDPNIGLAAKTQADLGMEYLGIAKQQNTIQNERQVRMDTLAQKVSDNQMKASDQAMAWAGEDRARAKSVYQPMQDKFIADANGWDSADRQDKLAAEASADVSKASTVAAASRARSLAAMGLGPGSGRYAGVERAADTTTALAAAGAGNAARNQVRKEGMALRSDAINMGNGLPGQAQSSLGLGVNSGSSAVGTSGAAMSSANQNLAALQGGYSTAMGGQQSSAGILSNLHSQNMNAWSAQQQASASESNGLMSGLGSVAGAAMMFMSSEEYKEDKAPSKGNLAKVKRLPIEDWNYTPESGAGDPSERHTGTYAEDFQRETGRGNGKSIPAMDAIGVTMGAIKELAAEVDQMKKGMKRPARRALPRDELVAA